MGGARELGALRRLREVLRLVTDERDPARLLPLILEQAVDLVEAERGFIIRALPGSGAPLEVAAARNLDREEIADPQFKISASVVERVATSGVPELVADALKDVSTRSFTSIQALRVVSLLCVPLRVQGRTLGVLYVDHRHVRRRFDAQDLAALEAFAVPAAGVLDIATHVAELERARAELARSRDALAERVGVIERLRADLAQRYRERSREANRLRDASTQVGPEDEAVPGVVARSPAMLRLLGLLRRAAATDAPVLILGESGVGKEALARALHAASPRAAGPFVAESCAALADPLLESELFGHEAGAFTGAARARQGLLEAARGGTFFLDEVGEMSPSLQAKLLRALQEKEVRPVGAGATVPIDVRFVAATHRDLEEMVARGAFRGDLYYRLHVVRLEVPPLRERPEDAAALLDHFSARHAPGLSFELQARELLLAHDWPGNARELENEVRRLAIMAGPAGVVRPGHLSGTILGRSRPAAASAAAPVEGVWRLQEVERVMVERALAATGGRRASAARLLGLTKQSLARRLAKLGLAEPTDEGLADEEQEEQEG